MDFQWSAALGTNCLELYVLLLVVLLHNSSLGMPQKAMARTCMASARVKSVLLASPWHGPG